MGNMCAGEADSNEAVVGSKFKVDKTDPSKKATKNKKRAAKGAENNPGGAMTFGDESGVATAVKNSEFAPDPELEQGFPEDKVEYGTTPCLDDVEDKYTKEDKARTLKKKDRSGASDAFQGDKDFAAVEQVEN
uniref:Uncharacterized protein n=1 Tax=Euplotes harpa TaxID=151035 RepID=A0A7S3J176_9SPIT|mmetsp:Transcript_14177/g.16412  ORF Transcript_14177/g.16412 Transcript_14177/m.16412 type:complete len:133 (+) Transcript_14177:1-399(+)